MSSQDLTTTTLPYFLGSLVKYAKDGPSAWMLCERSEKQHYLPEMLHGTWEDGNAYFTPTFIYGFFATKAEALTVWDMAKRSWDINLAHVEAARRALVNAESAHLHATADMARQLGAVLEDARGAAHVSRIEF